MAEEKTGIAPSHIPTVGSGKYQIKTDLQNNLTTVQQQEIVFYVEGYNAAIPQNEILAMYPPNEHTGDFAGAFPHVQFRRSTLPWEFDCQYKGNRIPYIFLVLLKEEELASGDFEILESDTNHLNDSLEDITEPKTLKILNLLKGNREIFPSVDFISQLAHVRVQEHEELKKLNLPEETSIVISHRRVEPDTKYKVFVCYYSAEVNNQEKEKYQLNNFSGANEYEKTKSCVVLAEWSFESISADLYQININRLKEHPDFNTFQKGLADSEVLTLEELKKAANPELARLISENEAYLKARKQEWEKLPEPKSVRDFEETENGKKEQNNYILEYLRYNGKNLKGYLYELQLQPFKMTMDVEHEAVKKLIDLAKIPLEHQLKAGGKIVSWYQGPFTNWNYSFDLYGWIKERGWTDVPDHHDYLNFLNEDTKMYDMTYAAAWQLGRLMIMNDNKVLQELKKWKNDLEIHHLLKEQNQYSYLPNLVTQPPAVPDLLLNYITGLIQFRNFPVYYLLPHPDLSTEESIKYFKIDNSWITAFLFGIFSAGPQLRLTDFEEYIMQNNVLKNVFDYHASYYGILLHSQTIKNWPHLVIELNESSDFHYITTINDTLRLYITDRKFSDIDLYLKHENAHFGKEYNAEENQFIGLKDGGVQLANEYLYRQPKLRMHLNVSSV
ncbi:hypothetical protein [Chryseobacterium mucoviscidosis]|uniref:hypothetical protein n=1 Tax=Chryseobacterium mucoviscidosis TaxID=1945581 RepID=UPI0031E19785